MFKKLIIRKKKNLYSQVYLYIFSVINTLVFALISLSPLQKEVPVCSVRQIAKEVAVVKQL